MIKVGITGCDNLRGAELVRILINHPDVELLWVKTSSDTEPVPLVQVVPGIIGESDLIVNDPDAPTEVDVVFTCGNRYQTQRVLDSIDLAAGTLRVIDLSGCHNLDHGIDKLWKYGLSEMQRRVLVHDAQLVTVPGKCAAASLIALMPMARNLLLNSQATLHFALGALDYDDIPKNPNGTITDEWLQAQRQEIEMALAQCQSSFNQPVTLTVTPIAERRTLAVAARFKCGVDGEMVRQLYEQYYEDHNFVYLVDRPIVTADIENTNKCLIRIEKDERNGLLTVHAVMDAMLKACAGNAVHCMNLMFGLHEKVGLTLKGTGC